MPLSFHVAKLTVPLSQHWSEVAPSSNELWPTVWLQLYFLKLFYFKSLCRFSVHLVFVLSSVKDISCSGCHCAGRAQLTSRWSLTYPQELYFSPSSPCRAIYSCSLMAGSHGGFSCTLCEFGPCLRTHQECYQLFFEMLVALVGAGDRVVLLHCCSRQKRDLILPLQTASLTLGRQTQIPFLLTISGEAEEPNFFDMNERRVEVEGQRWAVYLLTQWPLREQLYNKGTCDIIASPWRGDTSA